MTEPRPPGSSDTPAAIRWLGCDGVCKPGGGSCDNPATGPHRCLLPSGHRGRHSYGYHELSARPPGSLDEQDTRPTAESGGHVNVPRSGGEPTESELKWSARLRAQHLENALHYVIEEAAAHWQACANECTLAEWLGLTWEQYAAYVEGRMDDLASSLAAAEAATPYPGAVGDSQEVVLPSGGSSVTKEALEAGLEQLRWMAQWVDWPKKRYGSDRPPEFLEPIQPAEAVAVLGHIDSLVAALVAATARAEEDRRAKLDARRAHVMADDARLAAEARAAELETALRAIVVVEDTYRDLPSTERRGWLDVFEVHHREAMDAARAVLARGDAT